MKLYLSQSFRRLSAMFLAVALMSIPMNPVRAQADPIQDELAQLRQEVERLKAENAALRAAGGTQPAAQPTVMAPAAPAAPVEAPSGSAVRSISPATVEAGNDNLVKMSMFEVRSSTDNSYNINEATAGLKTRQSLLEIPQAIEIVPRALIDDMGISFAAADISRYVSPGVNSFGINNQYYMRGQLVGRQFKNGVQYTPSEDDSFSVETIESVKGLESTLFGSLPISQGMQLITTKVPLPVQHDTLRVLTREDATVGGLTGAIWRTEVDSTGPLKERLFGAKVTYRFMGAFQKGDLAHAVYDQNREAFSPVMQFDWKTATLRVRYEYQHIHDLSSGGTNFLNENNKVSIIGGRFLDYRAPWSKEDFYKAEYEVDLMNHYTDNLQSKLQISYNRERRPSLGASGFLVANASQTALNTTIIIPVTPASLLRYSAGGLSNQLLYNWTANDDYVAYYDLGSFPQQTNFGWSASNIYSNNTSAVTPPIFGLVSVINPTYPQAPVLNVSNANDSIGETIAGSVYWQQQSKFLADHLIATLGFNWGYNLAVAHTNVIPATYQESKGSDLTHKAGLVYVVTPHISLFGSQATAFVPQSAGVLDVAGKPLPSILSEDHEGGIKVLELFHGLLSGSADAYYLKTNHQNISVNPGNGTPAYNIDAGETIAKGFEYSARLHPLPGWDIIGTLFHGNGNLSSAVHTYVFRGYKYTWSGLTTYRFQRGAPLEGLTLGANLFHMGDVYVRPGPVYPKWDVVGAFASYTWKHYEVEFRAENLFDELYVAGGLSRYNITAGRPRNFELSLKYTLE